MPGSSCPQAFAKRVPERPISLARAFIRSTNRFSLPAAWSARAWQASFAEARTVAARSSSTVIRSPGARPSRVPVSRLASRETVTTSRRSARSRMSRAVIIFARLPGARRRSGFRAHTSRPSTFTRYDPATFPNGSPAASTLAAAATIPMQKVRISTARIGYGTRPLEAEEIPDSLDGVFQYFFRVGGGVPPLLRRIGATRIVATRNGAPHGTLRLPDPCPDDLLGLEHLSPGTGIGFGADDAFEGGPSIGDPSHRFHPSARRAPGDPVFPPFHRLGRLAGQEILRDRFILAQRDGFPFHL